MSELNLYQKIVEVRKVAGGFSKDGKSYGYAYVTGNQVLSKIKEKMNELNLLLIPSTEVGSHHTHEYKTAKGKDALDFVVSGVMSYTWVNGDNPGEREVVTWAYYGQQDDISKAFGSALTYSERYFLLKCLGLPTDEDDPDAKPEKPPYQKQNQTQKPPQNQSDSDIDAIEKASVLNKVLMKWQTLGGYKTKEEAESTFNQYLVGKKTTIQKVRLDYLIQLEELFAKKLVEKAQEKKGEAE